MMMRNVPPSGECKISPPAYYVVGEYSGGNHAFMIVAGSS